MGAASANLKKEISLVWVDLRTLGILVGRREGRKERGKKKKNGDHRQPVE